MRQSVYEMIFARLQTLGILDENGVMKADYMKFKSPGLMDLNVDNLLYNKIALAHNSIQEGDVMADPDMEVLIHPDLKAAESLTFKNDLGIFQEVYPPSGKYYPKLKKELNDFLNDWLKTIIEVQKYKLAREDQD